MMTQAIKPDDILSDSENFVELNGMTVRKGYDKRISPSNNSSWPS
jgi:hypothetical protein